MATVPFHAPFTAVIAGPTGSGKTMLAKKFIEYSHVLINPPPQEIWWFYSVFQDVYHEIERLPKVHMREGLPDPEELKFTKHIPKLIILDDHNTDKLNEQALTQLYLKQSHHFNCSVINLVQNLFIWFKKL